MQLVPLTTSNFDTQRPLDPCQV